MVKLHFSEPCNAACLGNSLATLFHVSTAIMLQLTTRPHAAGPYCVIGLHVLHACCRLQLESPTLWSSSQADAACGTLGAGIFH